jgi:drug/metabolite transporter (DMT)-like permease
LTSCFLFIIAFTRNALSVEDMRKTITFRQWKKKTKEKIVGYFFRIAAITIFGFTPIVIRYFLEGINGLHVMSLGFLVGACSLLPFGIYRFFFTQKKPDSRYYSFPFWVSIIAGALLILLYYSSVSFTSASRAILFLNFAPVIAIMGALLFFKSGSLYLQNKQTSRIMVLIFFLGTFGTTFLVFSKHNFSYEKQIFGDSLALLAMIFDAISAMALVLYTKGKHIFSGFDYIFRKVVFTTLFFLPFSLYSLFLYSFSTEQILGILFLGIGDIVLGWYFSYEAYKRMDGFINYLLFNMSAIITFSLEVIFFDLAVTWLFLLGGTFILFSSIAAEYVNTKCEKKMVKAKGEK